MNLESLRGSDLNPEEEKVYFQSFISPAFLHSTYVCQGENVHVYIFKSLEKKSPSATLVRFTQVNRKRKKEVQHLFWPELLVVLCSGGVFKMAKSTLVYFSLISLMYLQGKITPCKSILHLKVSYTHFTPSSTGRNKNNFLFFLLCFFHPLFKCQSVSADFVKGKKGSSGFQT